MAAKKTASKTKGKKASAKKAPAKKAAAKKPVAKKVAAKKPVAKKLPAKKVAKKKSVTKKTAAKKAAAKKSVAKKTVSKKTSTKKVSVKKAAGKKTTKKSATVKKASTKKAPVKKAARKTAIAKASAKKGRSPAASRAARADGPIHGVHPYSPKRGEEYMGEDQLEHFRTILLNWKQELMEEVDRTVHHMQDEAANFPDPNDRATQESEFGLELRTRDRERKLLKKIESALKRIEDGSYGYCEETGDEIGLKRLEARPVATLSLEAQERRELAERQFRDRDDRYR
jgi:DnaK suppressor protein